MPHTTGLVGTYRQFWEDEPDEVVGAASVWYHRIQNSVIAYVSGPAGATYTRTGNPDEYFVLSLFHGVRVTAGDESIEGTAGSVFIVPPGDSTVELTEEGSVWLAFTSAATDLIDKAPNREEYIPPVAHIAPVEPLPEPVDGYRLRHYHVDDKPAGTAHCYVHRTAMAKFRWPFRQQPRDPEKMSPHHHDDFEQASLIIRGTMIHHLRKPWGRNSREWLPDDHQVVVAPAVAISKPPDIHTTQAVTNNGTVGLIDYYSPVRWDIVMVDGMVTNGEEYPKPAQVPRNYGQTDFVYAEDDPRRALETGGKPGAE